MIASYNNQMFKKGGLKLDTRSSAIAEFSGIIYCLRWLINKRPSHSHNIHILVDCQYVANVCLEHCNFNSKHTALVQTIRSLLQQLKHIYTITFHWIPGHTSNFIHSQTDLLARDAALSTRRDPVSHFDILYCTDGSASGWVWTFPP